MAPALWTLRNSLLTAIFNNEVETAECLLKKGLDSDIRFRVGYQDKPAICLCVERGYAEMAHLLIKWGCSINQCTSSGETPLHLAAFYGNVQIAQLLLENRVNVKAVENSGQTPLHFACSRQSFDMVSMLVDSGSDLNRKDQDGRTALILACIQGSVPIISYLVARGADVNTQDSCGNSPLYIISSQHSSPEIISLLLRAGAKVNLKNKYNETPLLAAIKNMKKRDSSSIVDTITIVEELIEYGSDLTLVTSLGQTLLHLAVSHHQELLVRKLINSGCELNAEDDLGLTPLFYVTRDRKRNLVALLVAAGVNLRKQRWLKDESLSSQVNDRELKEWLICKSQECSTLQEACRITIRKQLGRKIEKGVLELELPKVMTKFINLLNV